MSIAFTIFPAIDLRGGRVVRLRQGRPDAETVYGDDPARTARRWASLGAQHLHVVDLDGAFTGRPRNWNAVQAILAAVDIPAQLGGGLRTVDDIRAILDMGVARVVVGTRACESPEFVQTLVDAFGPRVVVGIDARDGYVAVKGWVEKTDLSAQEFAGQIDRLGVRTIIFTDVSTDGMLAGPNFLAISDLCAGVSCQVIASGGVATAEDVRRLRELAAKLDRRNLVGCIIGKALYDGRIDLQQVIAGDAG